MKYSKAEVMQYVLEEDVKFIRLAFCDVFGKQKNISVMPQELQRAFEYGIAVDASAIAGFGDETHSDLLLHPDPSTLAVLPWRPEHGKVVRMYTDITYPDGTPFEFDTRRILRDAVAFAKSKGCRFDFGSELEFYLFKLGENGERTKEPYDLAGYMDIAPDDKGENVRREICLMLEQMGVRPESSHHEEGPGQNEINFRFDDAMTAADNAMTFQTVVKTIANLNGLYADFSPKPLDHKPGNGFHINMSVKSEQGDNSESMIAGVLEHICEMTAFLNPTKESYDRFGKSKAPLYVSWSSENRSQLIRIPAAVGEYRRAELRSPDPTANPYIAFALIIYAGLDGIEKGLKLPAAADFNLYKADMQTLSDFKKLPDTLPAARRAALSSRFVAAHIPAALIDIYCKN